MPWQCKSKELMLLVPAFVIAAGMALVNLKVGGPQVNIDDFSLYDGGFLVWFGQAPPQHAYLECWINGVSSLLTYLARGLLVSGNLGFVDIEFVSRAYSDFYYHPDIYYIVYRLVLILFYLATAFMTYLIGCLCVRHRMACLAPAIAAILYLFSFNAFWCNLAGRPDTLVVFFAMLGFYCYLKADYREESQWFWLAAASFGVAAGLKLHGAFFAIFAAFDLLRVKGLRGSLRAISVLVLLSLLFFMVADGTLLFDPLKYIKARMLTYRDDQSFYLKWGSQIWTVARGSSWVMIPLLLFSRFALGKESRRAPIRTVIFFALCWFVLFCFIRQLRAYWMLPALPLFYLAGSVTIDRLERFRVVVTICIVLTFMSLSAFEVTKIHKADYDGLRRWVEANIIADDQVYLVGYSVLRVPRSVSVNQEMQQFLKLHIAEDRENYGFTYNHLKNWEEQASLRLLDMLIPKPRSGFSIVNYLSRGADFEKDSGYLEKFKYIIVQDRFDASSIPGFDRYLERNFKFITQETGEGGEGYGLSYRIFKRIGT